MTAPLPRRAAVEGLGTAALVTVVVGSGIQATALTRDVGTQLLANSLATVFGLGVLIALLGPVSGAHFNPVVTLAAWSTGRRRAGAEAFTAREAAAYIPAQIAGAIAGAVLADAMFGEPLLRLSTHDRFAGHLWLAEVVATAGLVWLVFGLARTGRAHLAPALVAAFIGSAYWFTSSTSFANPAVTIGRAFTDTFAGIAPASVPPFLAAQLVGAIAGLGLVALCFGREVQSPTEPAPTEPAPTPPVLTEAVPTEAVFTSPAPGTDASDPTRQPATRTH
ncbi:aquaporin [Streptomyces sp. NPDC007945]|uniref:aquaporin n=1 Tax=Streptomyces sp. NPDC007945 TaxID=3364797 RepID=UPI0036EEEACC